MLRHHGHAVIVLEARDRVGGRVFTDADTSLSVPVDLGASIITGVAPNPNRRTGLPWLGVRADPSATVAAQLGLKLKPLGDALPLYDAATGSGSTTSMDARVERARARSWTARGCASTARARPASRRRASRTCWRRS